MLLNVNFLIQKGHLHQSYLDSPGKKFDDYRTSQLERHGFSEDDETPTNTYNDTPAIDVKDTWGENEGTIGHASITDSGKTKHIHP